MPIVPGRQTTHGSYRLRAIRAICLTGPERQGEDIKLLVLIAPSSHLPCIPTLFGDFLSFSSRTLPIPFVLVAFLTLSSAFAWYRSSEVRLILSCSAILYAPLILEMLSPHPLFFSHAFSLIAPAQRSYRSFDALPRSIIISSFPFHFFLSSYPWLSHLSITFGEGVERQEGATVAVVFRHGAEGLRGPSTRSLQPTYRDRSPFSPSLPHPSFGCSVARTTSTPHTCHGGVDLTAHAAPEYEFMLTYTRGIAPIRRAIIVM